MSGLDVTPDQVDERVAARRASETLTPDVHETPYALGAMPLTPYEMIVAEGPALTVDTLKAYCRETNQPFPTIREQQAAAEIVREAAAKGMYAPEPGVTIRPATYADASDADVIANYSAACDAEVRAYDRGEPVPDIVRSTCDAWMREGMRRGIL
jgi:hypothetical protein